MEIPRFYDACCKLEALGLLRTFVHDVSNERRMIYQLLLPLSGQEFFKQTVLDTLLLSSVGRRRHAQLKQLFAPNVFAYSENSKEITKTLADVFDVRKENIQNLQINRVKMNFSLSSSLKKASTLQATGSTFLYSSGMSTKNLNHLLKSLLAMKKKSEQNPKKVQRGYHLKTVSLSKLAITMPRLNFWKR